MPTISVTARPMAIDRASGPGSTWSEAPPSPARAAPPMRISEPTTGPWPNWSVSASAGPAFTRIHERSTVWITIASSATSAPATAPASAPRARLWPDVGKSCFLAFGDPDAQPASMAIRYGSRVPSDRSSPIAGTDWSAPTRPTRLTWMPAAPPKAP